MDVGKGPIRMGRVGCIALVVIAGFAMAGGSASVAAADDAMGIYTVVDGKLRQNFHYVASSYSIHHSSGSGSWDLKAVAKSKYKRVKVVRPVFDHGVFKLRGLGWTGPVSRNTKI